MCHMCMHVLQVGPGVMATLVQYELPCLRILRLGAPSSRDGFGWAYERAQLGAIGRAFPALTALDAGYANFAGGVSYADVDELVTHCRGMQHLDLSMVMTYMDFGPALRILAAKAPSLRSLATHGLVLPTYALAAHTICIATHGLVLPTYALAAHTICTSTIHQHHARYMLGTCLT